MANVAKQIIGSFEDIGRDIARESVKVPGDIVGKALESLGTSSQKTPNTPTSPTPQKPEREEKKLPPREWLAELAGKNKQREPTVQERFAREKQEKEEKDAKNNVIEQKMAPITTGSSKQKRGNLYGVKQKASSEMSKNVRQD